MAVTDLPKGIVGILVDDRGREISTATDFDLSGYGGFKTWEAQKFRVKGNLALKLVRAYCGDIIVKVLERYDAEQMMEKLIRSHGFKIHYVAIGYPDDVNPNS